jgi:hypothetical protein
MVSGGAAATGHAAVWLVARARGRVGAVARGLTAPSPHAAAPATTLSAAPARALYVFPSYHAPAASGWPAGVVRDVREVVISILCKEPSSIP